MSRKRGKYRTKFDYNKGDLDPAPPDVDPIYVYFLLAQAMMFRLYGRSHDSKN